MEKELRGSENSCLKAMLPEEAPFAGSNISYQGLVKYCLRAGIESRDNYGMFYSLLHWPFNKA